MKTFYMSLIFLIVLLQVVACSSTSEKITEEDRQVVKKRIPYQYHRNLERD